MKLGSLWSEASSLSSLQYLSAAAPVLQACLQVSSTTKGKAVITRSINPEEVTQARGITMYNRSWQSKLIHCPGLTEITAKKPTSSETLKTVPFVKHKKVGILIM